MKRDHVGHTTTLKLMLCLLAALSIAGCAGVVGAVRNPELPVAQPAVSPRVNQVAVARQIVGAVGNDESAQLGRSIAVGDFNGDGYADVAAGMPGADGFHGSVALIYGGPNGLETQNPDLNNRARITPSVVMGFGNERNGDLFGYAVAAGDFNGDTIDDLAISAPDRRVDNHDTAGAVYVLYGSNQKGPAGMLVTRLPQTITQAGAGSNEAGDHFGMALAVGDFDGDARDDLAIGAPDEDDEANGRTDSGAVFVRYGGPNGLQSSNYVVVTAATDRTLHYKSRTTQTNERFGAALAAARLVPGDRVDYLYVGAPGSDLSYINLAGNSQFYDGVGRIYAYKGYVGGHEFLHQADIVSNLAPFGVVGFGSSLTSGDFDGDGNLDLAAGAPESMPDVPAAQGVVYLMFYNPFNYPVGQLAFPNDGTRLWLHLADKLLDQSRIAINEANDRFGFSLVAADFNRDGFTDLAIGAPTEDEGSIENAGRVYVLSGRSSLNTRGANGLQSTSLSLTYGGTYYFLTQEEVGAIESGDRFGFALATGDIDRDGRPDLVVGSPYENFDGVTDQGAVFLARSRNVNTGAFAHTWTGTVLGDAGSSATLTLQLFDSGPISGSAVLSNPLIIRRCGYRDVRTGTTADLNATRPNPLVATHATGVLLNLALPPDVSADVTITMDVMPAQRTLSGTVHVRNVQYLGISLGSCADVDFPATLTRVD